MLRIRFGRHDLGRVALTLVPHAEAVGSVQALQSPALSPAVERWRRTAGARVPVRALPLLDLVPRHGAVPDFLTPEDNGMDSHGAAERLLATPAAVLQRQLGELRRRPPWVRRLCAGDRAELRRVADAVRAYHAACFADAWPNLRPVLVAELTRCLELLADSGTEAVLGSLGPAIRWRDGTLEVDLPPGHGGLPNGDVPLDGRGLRLVPSLFWPRPAFVSDGFRRPALVYPLHPLPPAPAPAVGDPLVTLLGHTRALALRALATPRSTTTLAAELQISAASASEHAATLRRAGLAATHRRGRAVRHTLTPLGRALLAAQQAV